MQTILNISNIIKKEYDRITTGFIPAFAVAVVCSTDKRRCFKSGVD